MIKDIRGYALTGATASSLPHFEAALRQLNLLVGDPVSTVDLAIAESPDFVMAHALRAWLHLLGTEPAGTATAPASLDAPPNLPATARHPPPPPPIHHLVHPR